MPITLQIAQLKSLQDKEEHKDITLRFESTASYQILKSQSNQV